MRIGIIYKLLNLVNGKIYIGQTKKTVKQRVAKHKKENRYYIQKALNKYGLDSFEVLVIDESELQAELDDKERYWIKFYDCRAPKGYNCTDGGDGVRGYEYTDEAKLKMSMANRGRIHSEEEIEKMRIAMTGKRHTEETRQKMRKPHGPMAEETKRKLSVLKSGENNPLYGIPRSVETILKISQARSGGSISEEQKQRLREINTGKRHSDETKQKMRESNRFTGKKLSVEQCEKLKEIWVVRKQKKAEVQELQRALG